MKIITVEEHFMSDMVNNRFKELNPPKNPVEENIAHRNAEFRIFH